MRRGGMALAAAVLAACVGSAPVRGDVTSWNAGAGNWSDANNWAAGEPNALIDAYVSNGGTVTITQPGETCGELRLGNGVGESGTIHLTSGTLFSDSNQYIGYSGTGVFVHAEGNYIVMGAGILGIPPPPRYPRVYLGFEPGSSGTYQLIGPGRLEALSLWVGTSGTGIFSHTDGNCATDTLELGVYSGSSGTYHLSGTGLLEVESEWIGVNGTGTFVQTGGCNRIGLAMTLGLTSNGVGTYEITGGDLVLGGSWSPTARITVGGWIGGQGTGRFTVSGGVVTLPGSVGIGTNGKFYLGNGVLRHPDPNLHVDIENSGLFHVMAGDHRVGTITRRYAAVIGTTRVDANAVLRATSIQGQTLDIRGTLIVGEFLLGQAGEEEFAITDPAAAITVSSLLSLGPGARFSAVPGSVIRLTGSIFENFSTDPNALAGLGNLKLIYESADGNVFDTFEVAGRDLGATADGFDKNFGLATLHLGGPGGTGQVVLVDLFRNSPDSNAVEALYVQGLFVSPDSSLYLNGIHLYVGETLVNPGDGALYGGGRISAAPEPGTGCLLGLGVWALRRRRRR